jgi:hypothetical protein
MPQISQQEFNDWLLNPVTKALKEQLMADRERLKEAWASGSFAADSIRDAQVRGQCEAFSQILALGFEDIDQQ